MQVDLIDSKKESRNSLEKFVVYHKNEDESVITEKEVELLIIDAYSEGELPALNFTLPNERSITPEIYERLVSYELQHLIAESVTWTNPSKDSYGYDIETSNGFPYCGTHLVQLKESDEKVIDAVPLKELPKAQAVFDAWEKLTDEDSETFEETNALVQEYVTFLDSGKERDEEVDALVDKLNNECNFEKHEDVPSKVKKIQKFIKEINDHHKTIHKLRDNQFKDTGQELTVRVIMGHDKTYVSKV